ncbi:MAG TPA: lipid-A-disaccharide synthase [Gammaproteobacteria bacterium]|nr:lipid-A-disaccharide synthase [Gammaproteobacteria bacterium]
MSLPGVRVALAAAEASGDTLGAGLVEALREVAPASTFVGVAGPKMIAAGCEPWNRVEEISVMGFAEVLPHLPRLLKLRGDLVKRIERERPDVFVGIDSPDFNLPMAKKLKRAGIPAVQYVSPQVWAWRQSRVKSIRAAVDLVLCVLPFEAEFYEEHGVRAKFIGHPLADAIPLEVDKGAARAALGLPPDRPVLAVLPGSRRSEVANLAAPFFGTAAWLERARPGLTIAVALASEGVGRVFREATNGVATAAPPHLIVGRAREVLAAADAVLTASGTASLEALLFKRPMVVAHRIAPLTYWIVRRLGVAKLPFFSLPNLLAGRGVVQEFVQDQVRPEVLGPALLPLLDGQELKRGWYDAFTSIHQQLRCDASRTAAREVLDLVRGR